jgi:hypothetical protein
MNITDRKKNEEALAAKAAEQEKMNKLMTGRELRIIEIKKEVNGLCEELGRPKPYNC